MELAEPSIVRHLLARRHGIKGIDDIFVVKCKHYHKGVCGVTCKNVDKVTISTPSIVMCACIAIPTHFVQGIAAVIPTAVADLGGVRWVRTNPPFR